MADGRGTAGLGSGLAGEPVRDGRVRYCDICARERGWPPPPSRKWGKCEVCGWVACCADYPRPGPSASGDPDRAARRRDDNLRGVFG